MADPRPIPFDEWQPDKSDRMNPTAEAKGVFSVGQQYAPFPDIQNYGPDSTIDDFTMVLLHFDGLDASTDIDDDAPTGDDHTWTAAGNAHQDTGDKMFGPSSLLCDGTGDWVSAPDHSDFSLGSGDWTIDFHFKANSAASLRRVAGQCDSGGTDIAWTILCSSGRFVCQVNTAGVSVVISELAYTNALNIGWHHLALVRTGDVLKLFIDGVQQGGNVPITGTVDDSGSALAVGTTGEVTTNPWVGWIDEFRISVGVARWTADFATDNDAFTKILLHFGGADASTIFADSALGATAASSHVWTAVGNAQIDNAQSKFGSTSGLFDGVGDAITMPDNADVTLGSGDFTLDFWFNCTQVAGAVLSVVIGQGTVFDVATVSFAAMRNATETMEFTVANGVARIVLAGVRVFTDTENTGWHHYAAIRSGNVCYLYVDGLLEDSEAFTGTINDLSDAVEIGTFAGANAWQGWIDELRLSVGVDRFPVAAADLPDANTTVLLHFMGDDGDVTLADHAPSSRVWTASGNAQIDTAQSKFGGSSGLFDSVGDWWRTPDAAGLEVGSSDFTVDCWFNCTGPAGAFKTIAGKTNTASGGTNAERGWAIFRSNSTSSLQFSVFIGASQFLLTSTTKFTDVLNTGWHHVAAVRQGTETRLFIDGVQEGGTRTAVSGSANDTTGTMGIGSFGEEANNPWQGWIDEFRLSIGVARWWDNEIDENGNDSFTKLLLHFNAQDTANTIGDDNGGGGIHTFTVAGNAQIDTAQSKFGGSSALFDGTGDWFTTPDHADFNLAATDWTVDCWFNCTAATGSTEFLCGQCDSVPTTTLTSFRVSRTVDDIIFCRVNVGGTSFDVTGTTVFTDVANPGWHHIAISRHGSELLLYFDGVLEDLLVITGTVNNSVDVFGIGTAGAITTNPWTGWIDEFRLSVGVARWPRVSTADNDQYTKILIHFDGKDGAVNINDVNYGGLPHSWTVSGNAQIDTAESKFGGASSLFDGTTDWWSNADHADFTLGSDDWTIDCWFNCTAPSGTARGIAGQGGSGLTPASTAWFISRTTGNLMQIQISDGSAYTIITGTTQFTDALNTGWHHIAAVRNSSTVTLYIDGVAEATGTFAGAVNDSAQALRIGARGEQTTNTWQGSIDEFRLSVGAARWTAAFTPPTAAYGAAMFTPPTAAYGGPSFVPPTSMYAPGFSASLPAAAYGADADTFEAPAAAFSFGGGAEDVVLGADTFYDSETDPHIFYGDATRLYTMVNRSAEDVSQSGGYSVGDTDTWQFAQFGNNVVAVSENVSTPQKYVMESSLFFGDLPGTPPANATSVARVGDFLWMGKDYTVYWSAFNDIDDWVPDLTTQAGNQELDQERGEIMCLVGLDYAAIFQERAIRRAIYVGGEVIWDFGQDYVEKARGCIARNAAVPWGRIIFYAADDGFYAFDGQSSTPIGYGKIDSYFSRNLNYSWRHKVSVGIDYSRKLVCFGFPTGSAQLVSELLIFSINDGRWTHDVLDLEFVFDTPAEPVTVDSFSSIFPVDDLDSDLVTPDDIDSAAFDDRRIRLAAFQSPTHKLGLFTGSARAATIDTKEFEPMPGQRALLTEVWPLGDYPAEAVSSSIGYRRALAGVPPQFTNPTNVNRVGYCPQRIDARFMRVRQQITAGADWRRGEGIHFTATPTGKR